MHFNKNIFIFILSKAVQHKIFFTFALLGLLLSSCSPYSFFSSGVSTLDTTSQERGFGGFITDTEIQIRFNRMLFDHQHELHHRININIYEGRILLTGILPTKQMHEDAVRLAWQVPGVKTVIDEIIVGTPRSFFDYMHDRWLMARINLHLFGEGDVSSRNYEIVAVMHTVYVVGLAQDQKELNTVLDVIRRVPNVKKVISYVRLMDIHEKRRRLLFNKKHHTSPFDDKKKNRDILIHPHKRREKWESKPSSLPVPNKYVDTKES